MAVHLDPEGLSAVMAAWQGDVPRAVTYPELGSAPDDVASAAVFGVIAPWPGAHTSMAADRADHAACFVDASSATTRIEVAADDDAAVRIADVGSD